MTPPRDVSRSREKEAGPEGALVDRRRWHMSHYVPVHGNEPFRSARERAPL